LSLVLASAYAGWAGSLPADVIEVRLQQNLRSSHQPTEQLVELMMPTMFSESAPADPVAEFARIMAEFHPAGFRAFASALAEADIRDVLAHIQVPTLLIYGDKDVRAPLKVARELHRKIPGSRLVVIPGVGHMCSVEAPERFNAEVRGFLRSLQS
jgi:pimeloyl-ACP methyl ester carboxylesterase